MFVASVSVPDGFGHAGGQNAGARSDANVNSDAIILPLPHCPDAIPCIAYFWLGWAQGWAGFRPWVQGCQCNPLARPVLPQKGLN